MLPRVIRHGFITHLNPKFKGVRHCSNTRKWQLFSSVCVERPARVSATFTSQEQLYSDLMAKLELEHSKLSLHEVRHLNDLREAVQRKEKELEDDWLEEKETIRAVDLEDAWEAERVKFNPADVDSEADLTSVNRRLRDRLFLTVQQQLGRTDKWIFPWAAHEGDESLRQAADRALVDCCGNDAKIQVLGNAPVAFYKYKYPPNVMEKTGFFGAKIFFFLSHLYSGDVASSSQYAWFNAQELQKNFDTAYFKAIKPLVSSL